METIQENEIVMVILGLGVLVLVLTNRFQLKRVPSFAVLFAGFVAFMVGWIMTVVEGFLWNTLLNSFEHICYAVGSMVVAAWCWKTFRSVKEDRECSS